MNTLIKNRNVINIGPNMRKVQRLKDNVVYREYFLFTNENGDDQYHNESGPADIYYDEYGNVSEEKYYIYGQEPSPEESCMLQLNTYLSSLNFVASYDEKVLKIKNILSDETVYIVSCAFEDIGNKVNEFLA